MPKQSVHLPMSFRICLVAKKLQGVGRNSFQKQIQKTKSSTSNATNQTLEFRFLQLKFTEIATPISGVQTSNSTRMVILERQMDMKMIIYL